MGPKFSDWCPSKRQGRLVNHRNSDRVILITQAETYKPPQSKETLQLLQAGRDKKEFSLAWLYFGLLAPRIVRE